MIIGISFNEVGTEKGILFNDLKGDFPEEDTSIQVSETNAKGKTILKDYYYSKNGSYMDDDGWYNDGWDYIGDTEYLKWGQGAWLLTSEPVDVTTAGEVKKGHKIHTFTDPKTLVAGYYPVPFCPNSKNVTWTGMTGEDESIQVFRTNAKGKTILEDYYYSLDGSMMDDDGWYTSGWDLLAEDDAIAGVGEGFWFIPGNFETAAITEVSPLGDDEAK